MLGLVVEMGIVEHGLGRDAADVETCPSEAAAFFDTSSL